MELKAKYHFYKFLNEVLSLVLAVSIIVLCASTVFTVCFQSDSFIKKNLRNYSDQSISMINAKLSEISKTTGFPEEVYINALTVEDTDVIFDTVVESFNYNYPTSFIDNDKLYDRIKAGMTNYCNTNGIDITENVICMNASLAVDAVNEVMGGYSTTSVSILRFCRSKKMVYFISIPAVLIIACFILLDHINRGRHRKFNYVGMGVSSAGFVMTGVSLFILMKKYIENYRFCENVVYNSAVRDVVVFGIKTLCVAGAIFILAGFIMLVVNYRYYGKRKLDQNEIREHNTQMRIEYLEEFERKNKNKKTVPTETVSKIDFDEE